LSIVPKGPMHPPECPGTNVRWSLEFCLRQFARDQAAGDMETWAGERADVNLRGKLVGTHL